MDALTQAGLKAHVLSEDLRTRTRDAFTGMPPLTGHTALDAALRSFQQAWRDGVEEFAAHGESIGRRLVDSAHRYAHTEQGTTRELAAVHGGRGA